MQTFITLQREEQVIGRDACDIVGGISPLASRTIQHMEAGLIAKQDIPRVEIPMNLPQPVG